MQNKVLQLDSRDNLLIALADMRAGEQSVVSGETYALAIGVASGRIRTKTERGSQEDFIHWTRGVSL